MPDASDRLPLIFAIDELELALHQIQEGSPAEENIKKALGLLMQMRGRLPIEEDVDDN